MRFLVIIEGVPGGPPMPPEQMAPLVQATFDIARANGIPSIFRKEVDQDDNNVGAI